MRNAVQMRWIEQAEAREILAASMFQLSPPPSWCEKVRAAAIRRLRRLGVSWARWRQFDWLPTQPQPALVRTVAGTAAARYRC